MTFVPLVGVRDGGTYASMDLISRLLKDRSILLTSQIDDDLSSMIVAQLLHLEADNNQDIFIYINSPGGSITAALAIYDVMQFIRSRVVTICFGQACSAASLLLCAGEKRMITNHARVLIHQPIGGSKGQAEDLRIYVQEIMRMKKMLIDIYAMHTKMSSDEIERLIDRDYIMEPSEAIQKGIVDELVQNRRLKIEKNIVNTQGLLL